jgi:hypothetical protein
VFDRSSQHRSCTHCQHPGRLRADVHDPEMLLLLGGRPVDAVPVRVPYVQTFTPAHPQDVLPIIADADSCVVGVEFSAAAVPAPWATPLRTSQMEQ